MKKLLVVPVLIGLALGMATAASALVASPNGNPGYPASPYAATLSAYTMQDYEGRFEDPTRCIGLSAGTAHHTCGTITGGPSGGLH